MRRYALPNDLSDPIKGFLAGREGQVGGAAATTDCSVLYRYRAGIPLRDLPERFGDRAVAVGYTAEG